MVLLSRSAWTVSLSRLRSRVGRARSSRIGTWMTEAPAASHSRAVFTSLFSVTGSPGCCSLSASAPVGATVMSVVPDPTGGLGAGAAVGLGAGLGVLLGVFLGVIRGRIHPRASRSPARQPSERHRRWRDRRVAARAWPGRARRRDALGHPADGGSPGAQGLPSSNPGRRAVGGGCGGSAARDQPVYAVRGHQQGTPPVLAGGRAGAGGRAAGRGVRGRAARACRL